MGLFDFLKKKVSPEEAFIDAAKWEDAAPVKKLLEKGVDVNTVDRDGWTALMRALQHGRTKVANLPRKKGAW
jgi:ankyrin repeat protein